MSLCCSFLRFPLNNMTGSSGITAKLTLSPGKQLTWNSALKCLNSLLQIFKNYNNETNRRTWEEQDEQLWLMSLIKKKDKYFKTKLEIHWENNMTIPLSISLYSINPFCNIFIYASFKTGRPSTSWKLCRKNICKNEKQDFLVYTEESCSLQIVICRFLTCASYCYRWVGNKCFHTEEKFFHIWKILPHSVETSNTGEIYCSSHVPVGVHGQPYIFFFSRKK